MSETDPSADEPHDQLREEAATWFARMRGEDADMHQAAFEDWLARGAAHRAAYNRIGDMFAAAKVLKQRPGGEGSAVRWSRRTAAATVGLCALAASVPLALTLTSTPRETAKRSVSHIAEYHPIQSLALAASGRVTLDADATFVNGIGGNRSVSRLERGRVRFVVGSDVPQQQILASSFRVQPDRGAFDLWLRSDGSLDAQALAGTLRIHPAVLRTSPEQPRWIRLTAGQHLRLSPTGHVIAFGRSATEDWPHGILEYRGRPLAEVLEEANRYSPVKIVLADPSQGDRRVSGRFRVSDPVALAARLAAALSLAIDTSQPGEVLLAPKNLSRAP